MDDAIEKGHVGIEIVAGSKHVSLFYIFGLSLALFIAAFRAGAHLLVLKIELAFESVANTHGSCWIICMCNHQLLSNYCHY